MTNYSEFFKKATGGYSPFDYQRLLAEDPECKSRLINIPTGCGKTAAVVLAWLWNRVQEQRPDWPRRLVFCLPMRTLVEQTRDNVHKWLGNLENREWKGEGKHNGKIGLHVLMGGEEREDNPWDLYPEYDAILIGTQDMLLSRALNRGYGMSRYRWPMHFGLLNNDCLWVLDEVQLMGSGLPTTAQLEAFRVAMRPATACRSWWMSATSEWSWLKTIDFDPTSLGEATNLPEEDLAKLLDAPKALHQVTALKNDLKALAKEIVAAFGQSNRLTLVVVNTVKTARKLFAEVEKLTRKASTKPLLLHSRFRPEDRAAILEQVLAAEGQRRLVISTQVIEAGVDLSAATLFTEMAPWSSLVQRFGRCNRRGTEPDAKIHWFEPASAAPYTEEQLAEARQRLSDPTLTTASPSALRNVPIPAADRPAAAHVIRRRDLIELFDTTPDLAGNDLDIDRYIRDADDRGVQVFWRDWVQRWDGQPPTLKATATAAPEKHELCPTPIGELRGIIESGVAAFVWDYLERQWQKAESQRLLPGQNYLLHVSAGRYSPDTGWDLDATALVSDLRRPDELRPPEANDSDDLSEFAWDSIAGHTDKVVAELGKIIAPLNPSESSALELAARWHDRGKAHKTFQGAVLDDHNGSERPNAWRDRRDIGKAPGGANGWWARYNRRHFRHEFASALAALHPSAELPAQTWNLIAYLVAAHHGRVRLSLRSLPDERRPPDGRRFARGVWQGDELASVDLGGGIIAPAVVLSLEPMELGECVEEPFAGEASWLDRALRLRDQLGPFRLAYLETLLRAADERASMLAK